MRMVIVRCGNCGAELLVSKERLPICGKCGTSLSAGQESREGGGLIRRILSFLKTPASPAHRRLASREPTGANLKSKIERLAKRAWESREESKTIQLVRHSKSISAIRSNEELVTTLLKHVRRIAPGLSVPMMTPRIVTERLCEAAGQFVDEAGWVKIVVGVQFFDDAAAARAILCHELCHYVLEASGIRERSTSENERLTDAAMFVFGLGDIFIAGYRRAAGRQYRTGHRLGYLSDDEYRYVDCYVSTLRTSGEAQEAAETELERRLKTVVPDERARTRLIECERKKYPMKSRGELIELVLDSVAKDSR